MQAVSDLKIFDQNFYQVGGTLSANAPSYVVRTANQELYDALQQGEFCYILDSRQVGKSTLIIHAAERLRSDGVRIAQLDFSEPGRAGITPEIWYYTLLTQLGEALRLLDELETFWDANVNLAPLSRWIKAIEQVVLPSHPSPLVIFIDEVDSLLSLSFAADEIFGAIRACYTHRAERPDLKRLTFCLAGSASPTQLVSDPRVTPFNIGRRIIPTDFTKEEAAKLVKGSEHVPAAKKLLRRILYWTGGHPYLTQALCRALAVSSSLPTLRDVDNCCKTLFFAHEPKESDHLAHMRNRLLHIKEDVAPLLDLYARVLVNPRAVAYDPINPLHTTLRLSGFVWAEEGFLRVRNRVYERVFNRKWIRATMPDAELQRQNAAYRRGILRATGIAGAVTCIMALLTFWAISEAQRANINTVKASKKEREANHNAREAQIAKEDATKQAKQRQIALNIAQEQTQKAMKSEQAEAKSTRKAKFALRQARIAQGKATNAAERARKAANEESKQKQSARVEADRATHLLYITNMNLLQREWEHGNMVHVKKLLHETKSYKPHGFEWGYWNQLCHFERRTIPGTGGTVNCIAVSPDGKRIAAGIRETAGYPLRVGHPSQVMVWDAKTGRSLFALKQERQIISIAYSPDSKYIAAGNDGGFVTVWNAYTGRVLLNFHGHRTRVSSIAFSPDSERIVTTGWDQTTRIWATATCQQLLTLEANERLDNGWGVAFSPDGIHIATCGEDGAVIRDAGTGQTLFDLRGHSGLVEAVAFAPDGKRLVTGGEDGTARIWNTETGKQLQAYRGYGKRIHAVAFSADGKRIAFGTDDLMAVIWNTQTDHVEFVYKGDIYKGFTSSVESVAFFPDGQQLATSEDSTVRVWDALHKPVTSFRGHTQEIYDIAFSPDGKRFVTGSFDKVAHVWDAATHKMLLTLKGHTVTVASVAYSPDGQHIATCGGGLWENSPGEAKVWDAQSGQELFALHGHSARIHSIFFSPDGKRIATASDDKTARIWDAATGRELFILQWDAASFRVWLRSLAISSSEKSLLERTHGIDGAIHFVAFHSNSNQILTGYRNGIIVWNAMSGHAERFIPISSAHIGAAFSRMATISPSNKHIAWSHEAAVTLLSIATGHKKWEARGHVNSIRSISFSPDGKRMLTCPDSTWDNDFTLRVWDVATGRELLTLDPLNAVSSAIFSPDGNRIVVGHCDGTISVWSSASTQK